MIHQHYGTLEIIRQCVRPGMIAMCNGRTYRVSAVIHERKWIYLHSAREIIRIDDCVIDIFLDSKGNPLINRNFITHYKHYEVLM